MKLISLLGFLGVLWTLLKISFPSSAYVIRMLPLLPWWVFITFCAYSLFLVGWRLAFFPECPEAYESLQKEIAEAHKDLERRGFDFDKDFLPKEDL